MITFAILLIALLAIVITAAVIAIIGGVGFVAIFGDIIIFVLIVWLLIKLFRRGR